MLLYRVSSCSNLADLFLVVTAPSEEEIACSVIHCTYYLNFIFVVIYLT